MRGKKPLGLSVAQTESLMFNRLRETIKVQSLVPSRMKRVSTLDVQIDSSLKVRRCTLVITSCDANLNSKDEIKDEDQDSSNHITIWEADDLEIEVEPADVPKTLEDGVMEIKAPLSPWTRKRPRRPQKSPRKSRKFMLWSETSQTLALTCYRIRPSATQFLCGWLPMSLEEFLPIQPTTL